MIEAMLELARRALANACAPYSRFRVGAIGALVAGGDRRGELLPLAFGPDALGRPRA